MPLLRHFFFLSIACVPLLTTATATQESQLETLLSAPTTEAFQTALQEAKDAGLTKQAQLEARFLHHVDRQDTTALAKLSPELLAHKDSFSAENSLIFSLEEDWLAIIHYTQSLAALQAGDSKGFETHIKQAFWLSPRQASAFAPHIDQFRLAEAMKRLSIDTSLSLPNLHDKEATPLFTPDSTATLVYFWSPWSREFGEQIDAFKELSKTAQQSKVRFIAVLVEQSEEVKTDAKSMISEEKLSKSALWCSDTNALTLSSKLRVQSAPTAILLSNKGKVLFNDHPASPKLLKTITNLTVMTKK